MALLLGQAPQRPPVAARGLEGVLHQIFGQRPVAPDQYAGVTEQLTGMRCEATGEFVGVVWCDPVITHRPPPRPWPPVSSPYRLDRHTGHVRQGSQRSPLS